MQFYAHQQKIIDENKLKCGLFLGTGSGKTRTAVALAKGVTLVICPKTQALEKIWEKEWKLQHKTNPLYVISKEQFKKAMKGFPSLICDGKFANTLIIDEAHTVLGVTPYTRQKNYQKYPKASQIYEAVLQYVKIADPERIYPLTATPIPQPMAIYALGRILGRKYDFYKFREQFYYEQTMRGRILYMPNRSERNKALMEKLVKSLGYTGTIADFVDVPDQVFKVHYTGLTQTQVKYLSQLKMLYPDPLVQVGKRHQLEQGIFEGEYEAEHKIEAIEQYWKEFGKVVIFCKYTAQINALEQYFKKLTRVFVLDGKTKNEDRAELTKEAERVHDCVVIAQSSVSAGWELPSFQCMIFASNSYSYVDRVQAEGRVQRINNVKKNIYIDLIGGEIDKKVMKTVQSKQDFSEYNYAQEGG